MRNYRLHDREFSRTELEEYCRDGMKTAPPWEFNHFLFISEWLNETPTIKTLTSGSTGEPKLIELPKVMMEKSALLTSNYLKLDRTTHALLALPSSYIAGKMMIVRALVCGWKLSWTEPRSNPLSDIGEPIDFAAFTPMQVSEMLEANPEKFQSIKKVLIGGGVISDALEKKIVQCRNEVFASYGMTETITHVALRAVTGEKAGKSFNALPGVRFSTTKDQCLIIEASHLGEEKIVTTDVVQLSSPFTFQYIGRADNVINSGGIKIFPEKIEEKIAHLVNRKFFISKEKDDALGERVIMFMEGEPLDASAQLQLISTAKIYLAAYEVPKKIYFTPHFELTGTDKILRKDYK